MLRVVIDTNLLVSYALAKGEILSRLIDHWERGTFVYLTSPPIVEELKEVLQRPYLRAKMAADPQPLIDIVEADTEQMPGELSLKGICRDPKDDIFISCAVEGNADYIVTGDKDLLDLGEYQGVKIIRAREFVIVLDAFEQKLEQDSEGNT
jgi:putative PIN family toxin of toxin-antitoxin system